MGATSSISTYFWLAAFAGAGVMCACTDSPSGNVWHNEIGGSDVCAPPCDRDEDGILDTEDNCPDTHNPQQSDQDSDNRGDVCDLEPATTNYTLSKTSLQRRPQMTDGQFMLRSATKDTLHKSDDTEFQMTVELRP